MSTTRSIYKVLRSIIFTTVLVVVTLVVALYIALSIPAVQNVIKTRAEHELSGLLKAPVSIGKVDIFPFNEVRLHEVTIYTPVGKRCVSIGRLGAGINLWSLVKDRDIIITYIEIISMNGQIEQATENSPLNIQFIIDAFKSKEKQEPNRYKIILHNIVIRNSYISFDRLYKPFPSADGQLDFNHLHLSDVNADVEVPLIDGDDVSVNLRRLAFYERSGLDVKGLSVKVNVSPTELSVSDFNLKVGTSEIVISNQTVSYKGYGDIVNALKHDRRSVVVEATHLYPADFSAFTPLLKDFKSGFTLKSAITGNIDDFTVSSLNIRDNSDNFSLSLNADISGLLTPQSLRANVSRLETKASSEFINRIISLSPNIPDKVIDIVKGLGDIDLKTKGQVDLASYSASTTVDIGSSAGDLAAKADIEWPAGTFSARNIALRCQSLDLGSVLGSDELGIFAIEAEGDISVRGKEIAGNITAAIPFIDLRDNRFNNIAFDAAIEGENIKGHFQIDDRYANLTADTQCVLSGAASSWNLEADIAYLYPAALGLSSFKTDSKISGTVYADVIGDSPSNLCGNVHLGNFNYQSYDKDFHLNRLDLTADILQDFRKYSIESEYISAAVSGKFDPITVTDFVRNLIADATPALVNPVPARDADGQYADIDITIPVSDDLFGKLNTPIRPGVPIQINGRFEGNDKSMTLDVEAPYLIQGKNKLIKGTGLSVKMAQSDPASIVLQSNVPVKKDRANLFVAVEAINNDVSSQIRWSMDSNQENKGSLSVDLGLHRSHLDNKLALDARLHDSGFHLNGAEWTVSPAEIEYSSKLLSINNLRIAHAAQFIEIQGSASANPIDVITTKLAGIDLEYIFNVLNINHVDFGGIATGKAVVSNLFSGRPIARTDGLNVQNLAYNGTVLGDARLESHWDNDAGMVAINADIDGKEKSSAEVRGGVYVTRDSLSFDFDADHIDIAFMKPFVSGFTSSIQGRASGHVKLYGTYSDIDLAGRVFADTVTMKVDYTNCNYSGSDSVIFTPGRIAIPSFRIYDKYGNSGILVGEVTHNCLHDPKFNFDITDVKHMLAYDTNAKLNPIWYGRVFTSGNAKLIGVPGLVSLNVNMSTDPGSEFTFVLEETQTAADYTFLTFSDKKKELELEETRTVSFEDVFTQTLERQLRERPDIFAMDLAVDVNTGTNVIIVMDPVAGDKIKAQGNGALQMHYTSDSDEMTLYGKYTLERGTYNFSLQDLILRNFKIEQGSSISFNGDPMNGILDITASYRVNTNLADLDPSFKNDPDLNRTTVPVDALLKVNGDIHSPEINFDLRLPTVTSEVERKMRSIVSTEDMMNRQVIYLLALNRFYTPEYTGGEQGGELASVASSTLSTQIQNILGSLTDKLSVAPSIKSEKSDLSDMEFDLALSSSLFENRLLLNGNLGYRDKATSQTTFVGDFDLEYLLSRDGRLRLKAYNHFNDASYYLKSALTTQGIGVIYRKDFDDPFTFLKRMFRRRKQQDEKVEDKSR